MMHPIHRLRRLALLLLILAAPAGCVSAQGPTPATAAPDAATAAGTATAQRPLDLERLDAYIRDALADWEIPGLAVAVVRNDSVIFARGYGERRAGSGEPVDEHTLFAIASTTKAFTVGALGMLVDEEVLDWDDPVTEHLPEFQLQDPYVTRNVTIRDLLTHRIGVAREDNVWIAAPIDRPEIVRRARFLEQSGGFRQAYGYNNIMYMVAGEVVAAASGMSWDEFVETRILEPLGMRRTTTRFAEAQARENVTEAHTRSDGELVVMDRRNYDALGPAGSMFSSAREMAEWLRLHLGEGEYEGERLLEEETIREMHEPQVVMRIDTTTRRMFPTRNFAAYGLGWRMEDYHGRKVVQHTGAVNYTRTQVGFIPSENIGFVAMANLSSSTLQTALMHQVFDMLLGLPETDWSAEYLALQERSAERSARSAERLEEERVAGTSPSLDLEDYAGTYSDELYGDIEVELLDGQLVLRYAPEYVADLEHWHHDTFRAHWRSTGFGSTFVTFGIDARAEAHSLDLQGFTTFRR